LWFPQYSNGDREHAVSEDGQWERSRDDFGAIIATLNIDVKNKQTSEITHGTG